MNIKQTIGLLSIILLLSINSANAQDSLTCRVVRDYGDGTYLVEIDGKTLLAITEEDERKIIKLNRDLLDARREIALRDSLIANYDLTKAWYDTTVAHQREYIAGLEEVLTEYKGLVSDYKRLREPWFKLMGGIGATGEDKNPAVMMGLAVRRFRAWGFLQEQNSGVLVGTEFRLF